MKSGVIIDFRELAEIELHIHCKGDFSLSPRHKISKLILIFNVAVFCCLFDTYRNTQTITQNNVLCINENCLLVAVCFSALPLSLRPSVLLYLNFRFCWCLLLLWYQKGKVFLHNSQSNTANAVRSDAMQGK